MTKGAKTSKPTEKQAKAREKQIENLRQQGREAFAALEAFVKKSRKENRFPALKDVSGMYQIASQIVSIACSLEKLTDEPQKLNKRQK